MTEKGLRLEAGDWRYCFLGGPGAAPDVAFEEADRVGA
jgi:hypothetical protein